MKRLIERVATRVLVGVLVGLLLGAFYSVARAQAAPTSFDQRVTLQQVQLQGALDQAQIGANRAAQITAKLSGGTGPSTYANTRYVSKALTVTPKSMGKMALKSYGIGLLPQLAISGVIAAAGWAIDELSGEVQTPGQAAESCSSFYRLAPYTINGKKDFCSIDSIIAAYPIETESGTITLGSAPTAPSTDYAKTWYTQCYSWTGQCGYSNSVMLVPESYTDQDSAREPRPITPEEFGEAIQEYQPDLQQRTLDDAVRDRRVAEEWDEWRDFRDRMVSSLDDSNGNLDDATDPDIVGAPNVNPDDTTSTGTQTQEQEIPTDCDLFEPGCQIRDWLTEDTPEPPAEPVPEWDVREYGPDDFSVQNGLPGGGSCPAPTTLTFMGKSVTFDVWQPICQFMVTTRPITIAGGWFIAILLVGRRK